MIPFILVAIVMAAVAIAIVVRPLLRRDVQGSPARVAALATAIGVPVVAALLYASVSNWQWGEQPAVDPRARQVEDMVAQLEERLEGNPDDAEGWTMLGRSFVVLGRYPRAVDAYQRAYDLTKGESVAAITGLAEALIMNDDTALDGRAGELIEDALAKSPGDPRALWYGSLAALSSGRLAVARDRMRLLLAQDPPPEVRNVLETQIADITVQLRDEATAGQSGGAGQPAAAAAATVDIAVSLAPDIAARITTPLSLFVLARGPEGGAPLAVTRLSTDQLPTTVQLGDANAMVPGRTLGSVPRVQIVARVSQSGSPQAQSGDFFGEADYVVQPGTGSVSIVIDRVAP